jgi:hypothetical protein
LLHFYKLPSLIGQGFYQPGNLIVQLKKLLEFLLQAVFVILKKLYITMATSNFISCNQPSFSSIFLIYEIKVMNVTNSLLLVVSFCIATIFLTKFDKMRIHNLKITALFICCLLVVMTTNLRIIFTWPSHFIHSSGSVQ